MCDSDVWDQVMSPMEPYLRSPTSRLTQPIASPRLQAESLPCPLPTWALSPKLQVRYAPGSTELSGSWRRWYTWVLLLIRPKFHGCLLGMCPGWCLHCVLGGGTVICQLEEDPEWGLRSRECDGTHVGRHHVYQGSEIWKDGSFLYHGRFAVCLPRPLKLRDEFPSVSVPRYWHQVGKLNKLYVLPYRYSPPYS